MCSELLQKLRGSYSAFDADGLWSNNFIRFRLLFPLCGEHFLTTFLRNKKHLRRCAKKALDPHTVNISVSDWFRCTISFSAANRLGLRLCSWKCGEKARCRLKELSFSPIFCTLQCQQPHTHEERALWKSQVGIMTVRRYALTLHGRRDRLFWKKASASASSWFSGWDSRTKQFFCFEVKCHWPYIQIFSSRGR